MGAFNNDKSEVVQIVNVQTGEVATGTTIFVHDDTIPQNDEGNEFITLAITPTKSTNKLLIQVSLNVSSSNTVAAMEGALFQDSTADALAAVSAGVNDGIGNSTQIVLIHFMTAGTNLETIFKIRAGSPEAGTTTFNGNSGARVFGGVAASSITIIEYRE